jgi:pimeloyl-ACP methyl ester carboxylesterase
MTVVAIHSSGMSSRQWRALGELLSADHRVIAPDLLGSGERAPWPKDRPFDFREDVAELCHLIDGLEEPVHLVGHSYGGLLALQVLLDRAPRIRSIALYDPVAFGVLRHPEDAEGLADLARAAEDPVFSNRAAGGEEPWLRAFVDYWNGDGAWDRLPADSRVQFLRVGHKVFLEVTSLLADETPSSAYASFSGPALILSGERSPVAARRVAEILAAALPGGRRVTVHGAGHMGPLTHAADVNASIAAHLARESAGAC